MARTKRTARKNVSSRPVTIGGLDEFYSFRMGDQQDMEEFLEQFLEEWALVRDLGVTELDGLLQLVQALPFEWKLWASVAALDFVHPDMEARFTGNLFDFVDLVTEQFLSEGHPPSGIYPPLNHFIPSVHQILDDILTPKKENIEPESVESVVENPTDFEEYGYYGDDFQYCAGGEITSIDLDLYGQPFALSPPSSPFCFPSSPPGIDMPSTSGNINVELETQPSVGTSRLQPLPISDTSFGNEPPIPCSGAPVQPKASPSHHQEESDPETPEGYYNVGY